MKKKNKRKLKSCASLVILGLALMFLAIDPAMAANITLTFSPAGPLTIREGETIFVDLVMVPNMNDVYGVQGNLECSGQAFEARLESVMWVEAYFSKIFSLSSSCSRTIPFFSAGLGSNATLASGTKSEVIAKIAITGAQSGSSNLYITGLKASDRWADALPIEANYLQVYVSPDTDPYTNVSFSNYYIYLKDETTGGIYFYENGKRRGFGSMESYQQRNPNNTGLIVMSSALINAIPEGPSIHVFSTGNDVILEGSAGMPKYRMRDGYRRPISNWTDYLAKGWGGYNRSVLDIELMSIPVGAPI